ncbi:MAG: methyltransferase domain-containing protein [Patescibacteria group bacterium]
MSEKKLDNQFVREAYNQSMGNYPAGYHHWRWFREAISRYHYKQSKRSFLYALKGSHFDKALEIGGGDGEWTKILLSYVGQIDFYDISEEMMKQAKNRLADKQNINFFLGDFLENDLSDYSYDFILSFRSFEYFDDKEKFFQETKRLLKSGGKMIMVSKSPHYDWKKYYQSKKLHSGILPIQEIIKMFASHDFEIELVKPAIVGKKLSWPLMRFLFDIFHRSNYLFKFNILPLFILQYISESFIIKVVKK